MGFELITTIVTVVSTVVLVGVTLAIALSSNRLTSNTEKFSHGNLIINFQDKLSAAILQEQEIINKHLVWKVTSDDLEASKIIESFMIKYLNITNAIAYLFVMEKSILEKNTRNTLSFISHMPKNFWMLKAGV